VPSEPSVEVRSCLAVHGSPFAITSRISLPSHCLTAAGSEPWPDPRELVHVI
jgi:hypothetical protein